MKPLLAVLLWLQVSSAFASGREGEALVTPILWIVAFVVLTFVTLVLGGGLLGAFRASRSGESMLKGGGRGLLQGAVRFLVVMAVSFALVTFLGLLWIAYAFLFGGTIKPS
ncbi:MAG: hypothetical protein ACT4PK_11495 [Gammaproteobacteria bacterium]